MRVRAKMAPTVKDARAVRRVGKKFMNLVRNIFQSSAAFWRSGFVSFSSSGSLSLLSDARLRRVVLLLLLLRETSVA